MTTDAVNLVASWRWAARDLGVRIRAPFVVTVDEMRLEVPLLVEDFGAVNGMLIVPEYGLVRAWRDQIGRAGYGFSVLEEPPTADYVRAEFVDLLTDWGWTGKPDERPEWMNSTDLDEGL